MPINWLIFDTILKKYQKTDRGRRSAIARRMRLEEDHPSNGWKRNFLIAVCHSVASSTVLSDWRSTNLFSPSWCTSHWLSPARRLAISDQYYRLVCWRAKKIYKIPGAFIAEKLKIIFASILKLIDIEDSPYWRQSGSIIQQSTQLHPTFSSFSVPHILSLWSNKKNLWRNAKDWQWLLCAFKNLIKLRISSNRTS